MPAPAVFDSIVTTPASRLAVAFKAYEIRHPGSELRELMSWATELVQPGPDAERRVITLSSPGAGTLSAAGNCTISSTTPPAMVTLTGKGVCTITASAPGNANYQPVSPAQSFSIAGSPQTITFANPGDKALGTAAFRLTASSGKVSCDVQRP